MTKDALLILSAPLHPSIQTIQTKLLDSHLALTLTVEMCLLLLVVAAVAVAARANRAVRCGNAPDERVSTQIGTSGVLLTEAERHWSVRVRAAQNTHCSTQPKQNQTKPNQHHCIITSISRILVVQPEWCVFVRCLSCMPVVRCVCVCA